jgi:vacuolar-type H+-ATPase subunit E/Vma4
MPENEKEQISYETYSDLIERELEKALEDIRAMREKKAEAKRRAPLFKAALGSARHYLRELENGL